MGNPSTKEAFARVNYLGMNDSKTDKLKTERLVGCATLDQRVQNRGLPEEVSVGEVIPLGEGYEIRTTSKKKSVPERMLVSRYLHALAADWEGIRATGEGVYSPSNHPDYAYFQCMSSLILGRLEYLKQKMGFMLSEGEHPWPLVWRYMMLFVEQHFAVVSLEGRSELDVKILGAWLDNGSRTLRFHALVLDSVKEGLLEKARNLLQRGYGVRGGEPIVQAGWSAGSEGKASGRGGNKQERSLCNSTAHGYGEKHVGPRHSANDRITKLCPAVLVDNKVCDMLHAFSGALKTDCRGGLARMKGAGGRPLLTR